MGQDQVSGGVSVLCWLAAPVAMFYRNHQNLGNKVKNNCRVNSEICVFVSSYQYNISVLYYTFLSHLEKLQTLKQLKTKNIVYMVQIFFRSIVSQTL